MSGENLNISCDAQMFARANEVLRTEIDRLRAENERLRAELDRVLSDWNGLVYVLGVNKYGTALDHARAMRRDAERYRWLSYQYDWRHETYPCSPWACHWTNGLPKENLDAAIDAAMKANGSPESP